MKKHIIDSFSWCCTLVNKIRRLSAGRSVSAQAFIFTAVLLTAAAIPGKAQSDSDSDPGEIQVATFEADATPDIGEPLAYNPTKRIEKPLSVRGIVIVGDGDPVVLCAVDWIGVKSRATAAWKEALAAAAGTTPERVSLHSLHQHDAPRADFKALDILNEYGIDPAGTNVDNRAFVERTIDRSAESLREAMKNNLRTVTHVGTGTAVVEKVASNRRQVNREGKEFLGRMSSTSDVEAQRAPVGTIDPEVRLLSFWDGDQPHAVLSYYTTHPQSYYRTGGANPDFVGIARSAFEENTGIRQVHFNGAGGNIAAGKWNDGWTEKRQILADRLVEGMLKAWEQTERIPVDASQLEWRIEPVALPLGDHIIQEELEQTLSRASDSGEKPTGAASDLGWVRRTLEGDDIDLTALRIGPARILHTPGELAVEYQLFAQSLYPDDFIANASYSDYDPGYISTEIQYFQGGYEASDRASDVAPEVEQVLLPAIREVLAFEAFQPDPGRLADLGYRLERSALQYGYDGQYSWVNGRAGVIPAHASVNPIGKPTVIFTTHKVEHSGPDVLRGLHYFRSRDLGLSWEGPFEESVFQREALDEGDGHERLVSDFVPKYHADSGTLLGIGHSSVYNENNVVADQEGATAYATFDKQTQRWSDWHTFELPSGPGIEDGAVASGRRVDLEDGSVLFPVYGSNEEGSQFQITVVRSRFDGEDLEYIEHGEPLTADAGSERYEPSLAEFKGHYYLTFHSDEEVYVARSEDGLTFDEPKPLRSEDGQSLAGNSSRQQWVPHSDELYLAYTTGGGTSLMLAQVDPVALHLVEETGQVIIPAERGGSLDNLDVTRISGDETWVIATEWLEPSIVGGEYAMDNLIHIARLKGLEPDE
ncbi:sialidase family protein [Fodinibius sp.]|uniref:sialidase family protein n=1 Tax=Fodinibius sp. TaxID=1872440 RepID=UPI00356808D5